MFAKIFVLVILRSESNRIAFVICYNFFICSFVFRLYISTSKKQVETKLNNNVVVYFYVRTKLH